MRRLLAVLGFAVALVAPSAFAADMDAGTKAKIENKFVETKAWAAAPEVVSAVKNANTAPASEGKGLTQEKWKELKILDPIVRSFAKNPTALFLKALQQKDPALAEAFVSAADGTKVAFIAKTSSWSHKGKPKHDVPMTGKEWTGPVEVDESTGLQQIQISVPVLDGGKPIGSLVVGFAISKLK